MSCRDIGNLANSSAVRLKADISKRRHTSLVRSAHNLHKNDSLLRPSDRDWASGHVSSFEKMLRSREDIRGWFLKYVPLKDRALVGDFGTSKHVPHPPVEDSPKKFHRTKSQLAVPKLRLSELPCTADENDLVLPEIPQTQYCISARTEREAMIDRYSVRVPESVVAKVEKAKQRDIVTARARARIERGQSALQPPWALTYR